MTFDTLAYAKKLKVAGVPDEQAEVQAEALKDIVNTELVTKRDLTEAKIVTIKWVAGMLVAQAAIVATLEGSSYNQTSPAPILYQIKQFLAQSAPIFCAKILDLSVGM